MPAYPISYMVLQTLYISTNHRKHENLNESNGRHNNYKYSKTC